MTLLRRRLRIAAALSSECANRGVNQVRLTPAIAIAIRKRAIFARSSRPKLVLTRLAGPETRNQEPGIDDPRHEDRSNRP